VQFTPVYPSASSVKRRRRELGLKGSGATAKTIPHTEAEQLVLNQLGEDPASNHGVQTIQSKIAFNTGIHLRRSVRNVVAIRHL
jgi:hypothetical protein